jgi:hypothetical protein
MRRSTNSSGGTVLVEGTSRGSRRPSRGGTGTGCGRRSVATSGRGGRRTNGRGTVRLWPASKPIARSRRRRCSACCDDGARSADWRRGTWRSATMRNGRRDMIHGEPIGEGNVNGVLTGPRSGLDHNWNADTTDQKRSDRPFASGPRHPWCGCARSPSRDCGTTCTTHARESLYRTSSGASAVRYSRARPGGQPDNIGDAVSMNHFSLFPKVNA